MRSVRPSHAVSGRAARFGLALAGALFLAEGVAKALDPVGYMAGLDAFHVIAPATLGPLSLGALGLTWTVLELLAGVAMLHGGLGRAPGKQVPLAGVVLALGLSFTYLALDAGALVRHLPVARSTWFGAYLAVRVSWLEVTAEIAAIALLAWLFTRVSRWPDYLRSNVTPLAVMDH